MIKQRGIIRIILENGFPEYDSDNKDDTYAIISDLQTHHT